MEAYLDDHLKSIEMISDASHHLQLSTLPKITAFMLYHKAVHYQQERKEAPIEKQVNIFRDRFQISLLILSEFKHIS